MENLYYNQNLICRKKNESMITAGKDVAKSVELQNVVAKYCKVGNITLPCNYSLVKFSDFVHVGITGGNCFTIFGLKMATISAYDNVVYMQCYSMGLRWCSGQTTRLSPLRFRVRSPVRWTRTQSSCEMSIVNALPKVVGFLRVLPFPPTGKVDRLG